MISDGVNLAASSACINPPQLRALADRRDDLAYIDVVPAMRKPDGTPKDIFVEDNLHMTPEGYALWTPLVDAALDAGQSAKAPGC